MPKPVTAHPNAAGPTDLFRLLMLAVGDGLSDAMGRIPSGLVDADRARSRAEVPLMVEEHVLMTCGDALDGPVLRRLARAAITMYERPLRADPVRGPSRSRTWGGRRLAGE